MASVTAFFAAILALLYLFLSLLVIRRRWKLRLTLGDGQDKEMQYLIRAHGNFAEFVPFALVLMALIEINGASKELLHGLGVALIAGRLSHAYSLTRAELKHVFNIPFRSLGVVLTFGVILTASMVALF